MSEQHGSTMSEQHALDHTDANEDTYNHTSREEVDLDQEGYRGTARDEVALDQHGYRGTTRGVVAQDQPWLHDGSEPAADEGCDEA
ncbi:hypothetical protein AAEX63_13845 [Luteococcus sp. H138]|uniref:hypothetical protein n=1 Tax=Luteococcus sp. H138 TaxID=3139404 RepID=UPI00313D0E0D